MAGVAEKARFYLERAVPQLREFEEKEIFTKDEIRTLVSKRSEFEHRILSPGATPADFLAYVDWEQSLDALRARRCRRLRIRTSTSAPATARTFALFDRAVLRHPGSRDLWRAYLDFAARARATKRWRRVAARALRMLPRDPTLWSLAGRRAAQAGDMDGARAYFMRGCRFCTREPDLWVDYARSEMAWLARLEARRAREAGAGPQAGAVGPKAVRVSEAAEEEGNIQFDEDSDDDDDGDGNEGGEDLVLPDADAGLASRNKPPPPAFDDEAAKKLVDQSPALDGAIPLAIFDVAQKQPFWGPAAAEAFFDAFAAFPTVSSQPRLVQAVVDAMVASYPRHASTHSCLVRQPLVGLDPRTADYPKALRQSLVRLQSGLESTESKADLARKTVAWIEPVLALEDLDGAIRVVLEDTRKKLASV